MVAVLMGATVVSDPLGATNGDVRPVFNHYTDLKFRTLSGSTQVRDEADFLRLGPKGELGNGEGDDYCTDGQTIDLWLYIHNGSAAEFNGSDLDGPGVARDTTISLNVPDASDPSDQVSATITSSNGHAITDSVTIQCSDPDKKMSLVYQDATDTLSTNAPVEATHGRFKMTGTLDQGAKIGYGDQALVPGCWEYSAVVRTQLKVVVDDTDIPEPETPPEPTDLPIAGGSLFAAVPLATAALSSVVGAVGYRSLKSRR